MSRVTTRNAVTRATVQGRPPSLADELAPLWSEISKLKARQHSIFPATVTDTNPVRIRIDGESRSLAASPDVGVPVTLGDRVRVLRHGTSHLIISALARRLTGESMFASLEPGLTLSFNAFAYKAGPIVTLRFAINGLALSSGNQRAGIGQLHPAIVPSGSAVPVPGYYSNGSVAGAITGSGEVSARWSSGSTTTGSKFFSASYPIE